MPHGGEFAQSASRGYICTIDEEHLGNNGLIREEDK